MNESSTAMLDIDEIHVEDGFNPRTEFDPDEHRELVGSIEQNGITSALTVRPNGGTHYIVVDGERRLRAAKDAGIKQIPVLIREGDDALVAALVANLIRADLSLVEEARGFLRLAELEKLRTNKQVGERIGKSAAYVGDLKRMLKLPEECLPYFASGVVPLKAERNLRRIAKVSPRIAACACELAEREEVESRDLVDSLDDVLHAVWQAKFDDPPTMIKPEGVELAQVIEDEEKRSALVAALREARDLPYEPLEIRLGEPEIDAARAAGRLIEVEVDHGSWSSVSRFITDRELAGDLAQRAIERSVREAKEQEERRLKAAKKAGRPTTLEEEKEAKSQARAEAKVTQAAAAHYNEGVGRKLIERRGAAGRKEHGLNRAKALAAILLADHNGLAAAGIRLVLPQLREIERRTLKSGESREKTTYASRETSEEYLWMKVEKARSRDEVLEILTEAIIAGALADDAAIARSHRVEWFSPGGAEAVKLLSAEIKAARPRRSRVSR